MSHSNVILVFSSAWCGNCRTAKNYLKQVCGDDSDKYLIIDAPSDIQLTNQYEVRNLPTFIRLDAYGVEQERLIGFNKNKLDVMLNST